MKFIVKLNFNEIFLSVLEVSFGGRLGESGSRWDNADQSDKTGPNDKVHQACSRLPG